MGHKVSPLLLRIGFIRQWHSRWFAKPKDFPVYSTGSLIRNLSREI